MDSRLDSAFEDVGPLHEQFPLLILFHGELEVSWSDGLPFVLNGDFTSHMQKVCCEVFKDCSSHNRSVGSNYFPRARFFEIGPKMSTNSVDWEDKIRSSLRFFGFFGEIFAHCFEKCFG